jgi:hypothetical protein
MDHFPGLRNGVFTPVMQGLLNTTAFVSYSEITGVALLLSKRMSVGSV